MNIAPKEIEDYCRAHTTPLPPVFDELREATYANLGQPQMQVGLLEGRFLNLLVSITSAQRVLERVRVGLTVEGAPAREGAPILDQHGAQIGVVTSGGFAPTLSRAIAIGFVPPSHAAPGTRLQVLVRGKAQPAEAVSTPFVPHRYVRKASS